MFVRGSLTAHAEYQLSENYTTRTLEPAVKQFLTFLSEQGHAAFQHPAWDVEKTMQRFERLAEYRTDLLKRFTCNDDVDSCPIMPKDCIAWSLLTRVQPTGLSGSPASP